MTVHLMVYPAGHTHAKVAIVQVTSLRLTRPLKMKFRSKKTELTTGINNAAKWRLSQLFPKVFQRPPFAEH